MSTNEDWLPFRRFKKMPASDALVSSRHAWQAIDGAKVGKAFK